MKKQCNLCGLREDIPELIPQNKTWCLVFSEEVDNKSIGWEYWHPDGSSIRNQKHQIAAKIKRDLKDNIISINNRVRLDYFLVIISS